MGAYGRNFLISSQGTTALNSETPPFVLVTGNPGKIAEARTAFGANLETVEIDLPEIQSLDYEEVLRAKANEAWRRMRRPLVVEEAGLDLAALNGFPGPLVKWMLEAVGAEGIARTAAALGDLRASARCFLLHKDGDREIVAEGRTEGTLVVPGRGSHGFGWDPVFLPEGSSLTFAELTGAEKDAASHRGKAWREMLRKLS
jgi:non-canonical purine NTP pyrophosphatase (RdgB/HAM1 family)